AFDRLVERAAGNAEAGCGSAHVAALGGEDALEVPALELHQGQAQVVLASAVPRRGGLELEIVALDDGAVGEEQRALEHVPQLADVSRPAIRLEGRHRLGGELDGGP